LLPALIALGIGLAVNNARAVLEAMIGHQSEFTRTPKYGIEKKRQSWKKSRYIPIKSVLPFIELGFALYFTYFMVHALINQQWMSVPFLALFQAGFTYVAISSLSQWIPSFRFGNREEPATLPA
ncbi:MAG: glycosyl transferase family 2, partial [Chthoniobacteraceae bacterium]